MNHWLRPVNQPNKNPNVPAPRLNMNRKRFYRIIWGTRLNRNTEVLFSSRCIEYRKQWKMSQTTPATVASLRDDVYIEQLNIVVHTQGATTFSMISISALPIYKLMRHLEGCYRIRNPEKINKARQPARRRKTHRERDRSVRLMSPDATTIVDREMVGTRDKLIKVFFFRRGCVYTCCLLLYST